MSDYTHDDAGLADPQFAYLHDWPTDEGEAESWMRSIAGALQQEAVLRGMNPEASSVRYKFAALTTRLAEAQLHTMGCCSKCAEGQEAKVADLEHALAEAREDLGQARAHAYAARIAAEAEVARLKDAMRFITRARINHLDSGVRNALQTLMEVARTALDKEASRPCATCHFDATNCAGTHLASKCSDYKEASL